VHRRILIGATAWLLGAVTATTGSVLVVSLLSQGFTGSSGQMLTQDMVNKELASEAAEASPPSASPASAQPSRTPAAASTSPATTSPPAATSAPVATFAPVPASLPVATSAPVPVAPSAQGTATTPPATQTSPGGTVLTSQGGEVVASCQAAGAYLVSWSPQQGYEVGDIWRGPAATARVTFESTTSRVTMTVQCSAGVPSATSSTGPGDE
jgi:hypothetical protein